MPTFNTSVPTAPTNPYVEAYDHVEIVRDFVTGSIEESREWAEQAREQAAAVLADLSAFEPLLNFQGTPPAPPSVDVDIVGDFNLPPISISDFGGVSTVTTAAPTMGAVRDVPTVDITPFVPSLTSLNIPDAPDAMALPDIPTRPDMAAIVLPATPTIDKPLFPSLDPITIPSFTFPTLPTWDAAAPEFVGTAVSTVLQWGDPQYATEVIDEVIAKLREIWAGGNGIPPAIENAIWERMANREDLDVSRQIAATEIEFSGRGYTEPAGVQVARIDAIRDDARLKKQTANRDIAIKMAEVHVENVRWATEQGVACENVLFNIWNNMAQRQFEAAKIQLDSQMALYNAQVSLFNARQQAYSVEASIYKTKIDGELARITVYKAQLEGELARGQLNEQRVRIYAEQIRALLTDIEVYKAQMQGASLQADVNRNLIEGFKAEVSAYAEQVRADKTRYDAYATRIQGELGKAQILDAEARTYSAYVSGKAAVADIGIKTMQGDIQKNELLLKQYTAALEADKARMQADLSRIGALKDAYLADTQRFVAQANAEEARYKSELAAKEAEIRVTLGVYEVEVRKYIADMEQVIRKAQVQLEALKSAGQVASTLAAGAMAGVSIGANLSGSGSVSASGSQSRSGSTAVQYTYSNETSGTVPPLGFVG